ncbi:MAG TPA: hypothetical protein VGD19_05135 [Allosphingosinicella sp.]|jgi:hypothetical protein
MKRLLALALLVGAAAAPAATVETATGDWSNLPLLKHRGFEGISSRAVARIHEVVATGECTLPGQTKRKLDLTVPFAVHFQPDGTLDRVIMPKMNCAPVEAIMGRVLLDLVESGEYRPTGENQEGWYRSEISFSSST